MSNATQALMVIEGLLSIMRLAKTFSVEYKLAADMMDKAEAEGRDDLNADERQVLLDRSQGAIDKL